MIKIETKLTGNLVGDLNKYAQDVQDKVMFAGAAAMAKVIYDEAKVNAPVAKGILRDAIYRVYSKDRSTDFVKTYHIGWNKKKAPHGGLIEFGTSRSPAYPFIRPAFDHIHDAIDAGKEAMSQKLNDQKINDDN